jgi:predicted nucleic acid-binding protein
VTTMLVDSNVLLDIFTEDPRWFQWSAKALTRAANRAVLAVNPIIYAEVSVGFEQIEDLEEALPSAYFHRLALPWEAGFLAGKCYVRYRRAGGRKRSPMPDFYVGAHAAVMGFELLTRDSARYRTYFPRLQLLSP